MIEFTYEDKLKFKELLTSSGFTISNAEDGSMLAKYEYNTNCIKDVNEFCHKFYKVMSETKNVSQVVYVLDTFHHTAIIDLTIFPEEEFLNYCNMFPNESYDGKLSFFLTKNKSNYSYDILCSVSEKHQSLFNRPLTGKLVYDRSRLLFMTDYPVN